MSTKNRRGPFSRKISVETNDRDNPKVILNCKGSTLSPFNTSVPVINFGTVQRDQGPQTQTVKITSGDAGELDLELLPSDNPQITTALRVIEPGKSYELDVTINPPWPTRSLHGRISFKTGLEEMPTDSLTAMANFPMRLQAVPPRFRVPPSLSAETELKAKLVWSGKEPGKVTSVTVNEPTLKVRLEEQNGDTFIVVTVPADYSRRATAFVTVATDDEEARTLRLPIMLTPVRAPTSTRVVPSTTTARPTTKPPEPGE